jgi:hypothetical protein
MSEPTAKSEEMLTKIFQQAGFITEKFFGELRIKYTDGRIVHIVREQSLKFKD